MIGWRRARRRVSLVAREAWRLPEPRQAGRRRACAVAVTNGMDAPTP